MTAPAVKPATIAATRVIRRRTRTGFAGRKQHCGYWLEVTIDGWLIQRVVIKRDTYNYLKEHGVEAVQEKEEDLTVVEAEKKS